MLIGVRDGAEEAIPSGSESVQQEAGARYIVLGTTDVLGELTTECGSVPNLTQGSQQADDRRVLGQSTELFQ